MPINQLRGAQQQRPAQGANAMIVKYGYRYGNQPMIFPEWEVQLGEQTPADWLRGTYPLVIRSELGAQPYITHVQATATGIKCPVKWKAELPPTI